MLERLSTIHRLIAAGKYPNATTLAELFEVSAKSIGRDIEFMRDRLLLPLEYNGSRFGYEYTEPVKCCLICQQALPEVRAVDLSQRAKKGEAARMIQHAVNQVAMGTAQNTNAGKRGDALIVKVSKAEKGKSVDKTEKLFDVSPPYATASPGRYGLPVYGPFDVRI